MKGDVKLKIERQKTESSSDTEGIKTFHLQGVAHRAATFASKTAKRSRISNASSNRRLV
jgi:hypothetical protein